MVCGNSIYPRWVKLKGGGGERGVCETKLFSGVMTPFMDLRASGYIAGPHEAASHERWQEAGFPNDI